MVISAKNRIVGIKKRAALTTELIVAMAVLTTTVLPLSFSFVHEMKLGRSYYQQAIAMEIIDSEMEILVAGEWRAFPQGAEKYPVRAEAAKNLPPGQFRLTKQGNKLRLEWVPQQRSKGINVSREWESQNRSAPSAVDAGLKPAPK